jgi:hypothetical protein
MRPRTLAASAAALALALGGGCGTGTQARNPAMLATEPVIDSDLTRVSGDLSTRLAADEPDDLRPGGGSSSGRAPFARENVSDSVMLENEARAGYDDSLVPR